jgi:hypothetical protein
VTTHAGTLDSLLHAWQWEVDNGRDPTPAELCRARPDLAPALARQIAAIRQVAALLAPQSGPADDTAGWPRPTSAADEPPPVLVGYGPLEPIGRGGMGVV